MLSLSVYQGDIAQRPCDLMILKHADGFHGVDALVADLVGFSDTVPAGDYRQVPGKNVEAEKVLFLGVGALVEFDYTAIRRFGARALTIAKQVDPKVRDLCMPIHGPGYGLDEVEAFSSLVAGLVDGVATGVGPTRLEQIEIVELNPHRAGRCARLLDDLLFDADVVSRRAPRRRQREYTIESLSHLERGLGAFGTGSEKKTKLFVAMPFKEELEDEWEISIQEASSSCDILCERIDKTAYVGDVVVEVRRRIEEYDGLIALLNGANPNVYLEFGYAWAKKKPTILLAKQGQELPFDVKGQRCLFYSGIADLRKKLTSELKSLKSAGVLTGRVSYGHDD